MHFFSHSHVHPEEIKEGATRQRDVRPGDGVLLPSVSGIHQRAESGRMHAGHDAAPQRAPHLHPRRVRRRAAARAAGKAPQQTQGGEAGSSQTEGEERRSKEIL